MQCFTAYKREMDRELMSLTWNKNINLTISKVVETEGNKYKCHYYEIKLVEGEREVYEINLSNLDSAWNTFIRIKECLLTGRSN